MPGRVGKLVLMKSMKGEQESRSFIVGASRVKELTDDVAMEILTIIEVRHQGKYVQ